MTNNKRNSKQLFKSTFALLAVITMTVAFSSCTFTKSDETADGYTETDISSYEFSFSSGAAKGFSTEGVYVVMTNTDGPGNKNKILNYSMVKDYVQIKGTGFDASLKVNSQMNFAAVQMFKTNSYDCYYFELFPEGKFKVVQDIGSTKKTVFEATSADIKIHQDGFNKIKVRTCDSGNVEVYLNGALATKLLAEEMPFPLTDTDKIFAAYNVKATASASEPAKAWLKMNSLQEVRK